MAPGLIIPRSFFLLSLFLSFSLSFPIPRLNKYLFRNRERRALVPSVYAHDDKHFIMLLDTKRSLNTIDPTAHTRVLQTTFFFLLPPPPISNYLLSNCVYSVYFLGLPGCRCICDIRMLVSWTWRDARSRSRPVAVPGYRFRWCRCTSGCSTVAEATGSPARMCKALPSIVTGKLQVTNLLAVAI